MRSRYCERSLPPSTRRQQVSSVPRYRSGARSPLPSKEGSLIETNSAIVFAHSFGGLRFLLHSLATGFSLASTFAFARKSSCPVSHRRSQRRAFGLLLISKILSMASPAAAPEIAMSVPAIDSSHVANSLTNPLQDSTFLRTWRRMTSLRGAKTWSTM